MAYQDSVDEMRVEMDKSKEMFDSQVDKIFNHFYDKLDGVKADM